MKKYLCAALSIALILSANVSAVVNLALTADEITTSSSYNDEYSGEQARDGIVRGEEFTLHQWITDYESEADLTLTWSSPVTVNRVVFYDRISASDNVASGTITFSDGTKVEFGALDPEGQPTEFTFDTITTTSAVIHITADDTTLSVGLDEVEFFTPDGVNVALDATAEASSVLPDGTDNEEYAATWYPESYKNWYGAYKAINGYAAANTPEGAEFEWASKGEPDPSITFSWFPAVRIGTIVLYDRINTNDHVLGGTIEFNDGTKIEFVEIPNDGAPYYIDVPDISATDFTIYTITNGPNPGFAKVEVYTEHFENGRPVGGEEAPADETPAETVPETPETPAETVTEEAAAEEAETEGRTTENVTEAPQTFDGIAIAAAAAVIGAIGTKITRKKRS